MRELEGAIAAVEAELLNVTRVSRVGEDLGPTSLKLLCVMHCCSGATTQI